MSNRAQEVCAEAICSALYNGPFTTFLGERDDPFTGQLVTWFRLSEHPGEDVSARHDPKQVMVAVRRTKDGNVETQVAWLNISGGEVLKGQQTLRVSTYTKNEAMLREATQQVVVRVLEIFRDVLQGTGVAGPIEGLAAPEAEDQEFDLARTDAQVGRE